MRVLIPEIKHWGHCLGYASDMAATFADAGHEVVLAVSAAAYETPHSEVLNELPAGVTIKKISENAINYRSTEQGEMEWKLVTQLTADIEPHWIFVPTADAMLEAMSAETPDVIDDLRSCKIDFVVHAVLAGKWPRGLSTARSYLEGVKKLRLLGRKCRLYTVDPYPSIGPGRFPIKAAGAKIPKYIPFSKAIESKLSQREARAVLNWPLNNKLVVALGDVAPRKAGCELIRAAQESVWPQNTMLVLAGQISSQCKATLRTLGTYARDRIFIDGKYLPALDDIHAYRAADVVWAGTPHHIGMSGTQFFAALSGRPSILLRTHSCGQWLHEKIGPGVVCDQNPTDIARAVNEALLLPSTTERQRAFCLSLLDQNRIHAELFN